MCRGGNSPPSSRRLILEGDPENNFEGVKGFFGWLERKNINCMCECF